MIRCLPIPCETTWGPKLGYKRRGELVESMDGSRRSIRSHGGDQLAWSFQPCCEGRCWSLPLVWGSWPLVHGTWELGFLSVSIGGDNITLCTMSVLVSHLFSPCCPHGVNERLVSILSMENRCRLIHGEMCKLTFLIRFSQERDNKLILVSWYHGSKYSKWCRMSKIERGTT